MWDDRSAELVAGAANLAGLEALHVSLLPEESDDRAGAGRRLAILARSPHLAGLTELTVRGGIGARGIEALVRNPTWTGLRKLDISTRGWSPDVFADADALPELVELRLSDFDYSAHELAALRRSPLLKQLRHFAVSSGWEAADFEIADAVDPDQIETFAIGRSPPRVVMMLRERFGDKLRHLPG